MLSIDRDWIEFEFELLVRVLFDFMVEHACFALFFGIFVIDFIIDISLLCFGLEYSLFNFH